MGISSAIQGLLGVSLVGGLLSGVMGGIDSALDDRSFWEGFTSGFVWGFFITAICTLVPYLAIVLIPWSVATGAAAAAEAASAGKGGLAAFRMASLCLGIKGGKNTKPSGVVGKALEGPVAAASKSALLNSRLLKQKQIYELLNANIQRIKAAGKNPVENQQYGSKPGNTSLEHHNMVAEVITILNQNRLIDLRTLKKEVGQMDLNDQFVYFGSKHPKRPDIAVKLIGNEPIILNFNLKFRNDVNREMKAFYAITNADLNAVPVWIDGSF